MVTLLHVHASPRVDSCSGQLAKAFLEEFSRLRPRDRVDTLDLFKTDLLAFDAPAAGAKYAVLSGKAPQGPAEETWKKVIHYTDQLKAADTLLVSTGMWNFSIPYRLKQYIDIIVNPGLTFRYSPQTGFTGLVTGKPVILLLARGGKYPEGTPSDTYDFQRRYLETIFRYIGLTEFHTILCEGTLEAGTPEALQQLVGQGMEQSRQLARSLFTT
jgi:FMN-dependent NADH-azoreductase